MRRWKRMLPESWMMASWGCSGILRVLAKVTLWCSLRKRCAGRWQGRLLLWFWQIGMSWTGRSAILLPTVACWGRMSRCHRLWQQAVIIWWRSCMAIPALFLPWFRNSTKQMWSLYTLTMILSLFRMRHTAANMVFLRIIWWGCCRQLPASALRERRCFPAIILLPVPLAVMFLCMILSGLLRTGLLCLFTMKTAVRRLWICTIRKSPIRF